jgi:hypothetical protein
MNGSQCPRLSGRRDLKKLDYINTMNGRIKRTDPNQGHKFPIIGKLKVGQKVQRDGKEFPSSTDYFICDSKYKKMFEDAYGDKPNSIQINFISDDFRDSCNEYYECRDKDGRKSGYGDGETWFIYDGDLEDYIETTNQDLIRKAGKWTIKLRLSFIVPKIRGVFGLFTFETKADKSSIPAIRNAFDNVFNMAGTVINVPFDLNVQKVISQKPGSKYKFPVVSLIPNVSKENMRVLKEYVDQGNDVAQLGVISEQKLLEIKSE